MLIVYVFLHFRSFYSFVVRFYIFEYDIMYHRNHAVTKSVRMVHMVVVTMKQI